MKNIQLTIPEACNESWKSFESRPEGGFCSRCSKTVIDFTAMSDSALIAYLKQQSGEVCGRFRKEQLTTYTLDPAIKPGFNLLRAGLIGALILGTNTLFAIPKPATEFIQTVPNFTASDTTKIIKGFVRDQDTKDPMPGVNILLKNTTIGTTSDAEGYFEFPVKLKAGDILVFSFIGMKTEEYPIGPLTNSSIEIPMAVDIELTCEMVVMGAVAINEEYVPKPGILKKIRTFFVQWF